MSAYPSAFILICPSAFMSVCSSAFISIYPSAFMPACPSAFMPACLSAFMSVSACLFCKPSVCCSGAKMIRRMLREKILKQKEHQQKELEQISRKLEKIRARTHRLEGESRDSWTHYDGESGSASDAVPLSLTATFLAGWRLRYTLSDKTAVCFPLTRRGYVYVIHLKLRSELHRAV